MNLRSCGGELNRKNRFYCADDSNDLAELLDWCADSFPGKPVLGAGFSLGGLLLIKYLGEQQKNSRLNVTSRIDSGESLELSP